MTGPGQKEDSNKDVAEARFEQNVRRLLRQGSGDLDAATLSRLNRARQRALAELGAEPGARQEHHDRRPVWQPALAVAAVGALAVALWVGREPVPAPVPPVPDPALAVAAGQAADLELVLAGENLDMIEDLEFYNWLDGGTGAAGPDPSG